MNKSSITPTMPNESESNWLQLPADVTLVHHPSGKTVLASKSQKAAVRISKAGEQILPLLTQGTSFANLVHHLEVCNPNAGDIGQKLQMFVNTLKKSGLLTNTSGVKSHRWAPRLIPLINFDPIARSLAGLIAKIPAWMACACLFVMVLGLSGGILLFAVENRPLLHPVHLISHFDGLGLVGYLIFVIPLHELAHAVAGRMAGVPISGAGLILHWSFFPGFYVEMKQAYLVSSKWKRFWIAAAGTLVELTACGLAAWMLLLDDGTKIQGILYVYMLCLTSLYFNMNLLRPSDGSHILEALLNDELLRKKALTRFAPLSDRFGIWFYRVMIGVYFLLGVLVLVWLCL